MASCPLAYRYGARSLRDRSKDLAFDALYVVGGLYGNSFALEAIFNFVENDVRLQGNERAAVIFNGDFNFFNVDNFSRFNQLVRKESDSFTTLCTIGNVEYEVANTPPGEIVGCGCAYPNFVSKEIGERADEIVKRLHESACNDSNSSTVLAWMRELPMYLTARVGKTRVGVIHGDPNSLSGWDFSAEAFNLDKFPAAKTVWENEPNVSPLFLESDLDAYVCTHTCVTHAVGLPCGGLIFNNGSSGMPNFKEKPGCGVLTRVSSNKNTPVHSDGHSLYHSVSKSGARFDHIEVPFDHISFVDWFLETWPENSPAQQKVFNASNLPIRNM